MYAIYGDIYHQYTPNVSIYTIHGSYGICINSPWKAKKVLRDMILHDVAPDAACYAPLIRAQLRKGDLESGVQLLSQMQRQQIGADSATFQVG